MTTEQLKPISSSLESWRKVVENVWCRSKRWEVTTALDTIQTLMNFQPIQIQSAEENKAITVCFTDCRRLLSFQEKVAPFLNRMQHHKVGKRGERSDKITIFLKPILDNQGDSSVASRIGYALQKKDINANVARRGYSISFGKVTQKIIHKFSSSSQEQTVNNPKEILSQPLMLTSDDKDPLVANKIELLEARIKYLEMLLEASGKISNDINDKKRACLENLKIAWEQCDLMCRSIEEAENALLIDPIRS